MADTFTAEKLAWLERVQDHPGLPQTAFSVAFALSRHMNRATGDAWPSQATIGAMAGVKPRQVRNLIRALADAGLIEVKSGGYQKPDRYRMTSTDRQPIAALRPANDCHTEEAPDRQSIAVQTGNQLPPNPLNEPFEERAKALSTAGEGFSGSIKEAFAAWWAVYPKKAKRLKAEPLFASVIKRGLATADQLVAAAVAYAGCEKVARGFVMDPTTWLNGGCWADEVEPSKASAALAPSRTLQELEQLRAHRARRFADTGVWEASWGVTPDLRAGAVEESSEAVVVSYLDPCAWLANTRTVVAPFSILRDRLEENLGGWLKRNGVKVTLAKPATSTPERKRVGWV